MRLQRHLMGVVASLVVIAVVYLYAAFGFIGDSVANVFALLVLLSALSFALCFVTGFNLRFSDPSLTMAQVASSGAALAYLAYAAGPVRALLLPFYMIALLFGAFSLKTRQQLWIVVYFVATFSAAVMLSLWLPTHAWRRERPVGPLPDGAVLIVHLSLLLLLMAWIGGHVNGLRMRLRAVNGELKQALEKIARIATYDELTGLYNRRTINELVAREKRRCDRNGASMCIAMLDVDHFKRINDQYGHSVGDGVLRMLSLLLECTLRGTECVGRYGGEEFLILLSETSKERAMVPLERLRRRISETAVDGLPADMRITVSIGLADFQQGEDVLDTVKRADLAMYNAKRLGRDRICFEGR